MQLRGPPAHGYVGDFADQAAPNFGLTTALTAEIIAVYDATFQSSLRSGQVLTGHGGTVVVQHAKYVKIWGTEGRLGYVEVFL